MKLTRANRLNRWTGMLVLAVLFVAHTVQACPGCKQVVLDGQGDSPMSQGFAYSIGFMFLTVMSVIGSLVWMMIKSARAAWVPADENAYRTPRRES